MNLLYLYLTQSECLKLGLFNQFASFAKAGIAAASKQDSDLVLLINMLVSHLLEKAANSSTLDRPGVVAEATEYINMAAKFKRRDPLTHVHKGNLSLLTGASNAVESAFYEYSSALKDSKTFVPALLSQASLYSSIGDHTKALKAYQDVLLIYPDIKPDIRVPIGQCYLHFGMIKEARCAFNRALDIDSENAEALTYLSILDWNSSQVSSKDESKIHLANSNARLSKV